MFDVLLFVVLFLSVIIFKEVNLVNRKVWVDKDLTSQRSLLRKLLKEATGKLLEEAFQWSFLRKLHEVASVKMLPSLR